MPEVKSFMDGEKNLTKTEKKENIEKKIKNKRIIKKEKYFKLNENNDNKRYPIKEEKNKKKNNTKKYNKFKRYRK